MAYEKQTWTCGETITADKLNHMEDGIMESGGGGSIVVLFEAEYDEDQDCYNGNFSYNEIVAVLQNGQLPVIRVNDEGYTKFQYIYAVSPSFSFSVSAVYAQQAIAYEADDPDENMTTCHGLQ